MEGEILNYSPTVMFRWFPVVITISTVVGSPVFSNVDNNLETQFCVETKISYKSQLT